MDIQALKSRLDIIEIAHRIGIHTDRTGKAVCPFHSEKTASLQFSREKQICTCFSSKCKAGTMDVVDLVKKLKGWELPVTLKWLAEQGGMSEENRTLTQKSEVRAEERVKILTELFEVFTRSYAGSGKPQEYLKGRNLDPRKIKAGYNIGQFHHAINLPEGKTEQYLKLYESLGLLKKVNSGYSVFGKGCVVFPLKNKQHQIVSFYFREIEKNKRPSGSAHYYLKNRQGLYPGYPRRETKKLILTESIIDAETLLQTPEIKQNYEVLACYGTEGTTEQMEAIREVEGLEEVVIFFDGDKAGQEGGQKLAEAIQTTCADRNRSIKPSIKIRIVQTPEGQDINSLVEAHEPLLLTHLIQEAPTFFLSKEAPQEIGQASIEREKVSEAPPPQTPQNLYKLDTSHPHNLKYRTETAAYEIKGGIGKNGLDRLIISLHIIDPEVGRKSRVRLDLYEDKQVEKTAREAGEKLGLRSDLIEQDLNYLADLLDRRRDQEEQEKESEEQPKYHHIPEEEKQAAFKLLKSENLLQRINELIGKSGLIGEENNRTFLFCIASSHKMRQTLHALVQGSSGSGKTHLVRQITDFMPLENVIRLTRVTESSFYNYGEYDLQNKLVVIEDYDGLKEEAELAFRELQSNDELRSSVSTKDTEYGSYRTQIRVVKGPISSMAATTRGAIYEDNLSRCFVIAVDESKEQTLKIIEYQNSKAAGQIDTTEQREIQTLLQNCIRLLKPLEVVNPFANKIQLPEEAFKIRRLNSNFQSFVKQVTLLNQYQRERDKQGRLITRKHDLQTAIEIMFDSIILKVDELDGSLRDFYEKLKGYIQQKGKDYEFTQREIRQDLRISKTQMQRFIGDLLELEYIERKGTGIHGATKYRISYWDDNVAVKKRIKESLMNQLKKI